MKIHDVLHGFEIVRARKSEELSGILWEMEHQKTGARLIWLENGETNKLFSIAFKTLPWDDTGVFHILEHSVLCGSDRFPVKEPFLDLLKSSMNTFLNAMTFADKTMYPVSSRNEQDFMNLTRVYLDAVFCPAIYRNPNIFRQEGWHYELRAEDASPIYKGVVFNEMKGAFASVNRLADMALCRMLFPDNCYGFVSGGDPEHIPDLTPENFLAAHRKFYHPTNAKIYLDGAVPLDEVLRLIDEEYLSKYEKLDASFEIPLQTPPAAAQSVTWYEIGQEEDEKQKAHIMLGRIMGTWQDRKKILAVTLLNMYLAESNESPLTKAVLQSGLAQDLSLDIDDSVAQPYLMLHIRNTEAAHRDELRRIIRETAEGLVQNGLDREELAAGLNQLAFRLKEKQEPAGLIRNIVALNAWLHGGDPMLYLECEGLLAELRREMETGYYEDLLREMLLDDAHIAEAILLPSKTRSKEKSDAEQARLFAARDAWTAEEKKELIAQNAALDAWQAAPDSSEALATLPTLPLSAVSLTPEWVETEEDTAPEGARVFFHPVPSSGLVHCRMYFNLADQPVSRMQDFAFFSSLLSQLPAGPYSVAELRREIKKNIGRLNFGFSVYAVPSHPELCRPFLTASFSVLEDNVEKAVRLVAEILKNTRFDDAKLIRDLLNQQADGMQRAILSSGNVFAISRALRTFSADCAVQEETGGYSYYTYLTQLRAEFDDRLAAFRAFAEETEKNLIVSRRLTLSETASVRHPALLSLLSALGDGQSKALPTEMRLDITGKPVREAIRIPAGISFAASCCHLSRLGQKFRGELLVLSGLLSFGYLWNEVRVKGGAYGCGFRAAPSGSTVFYSYRDPSPAHSLTVFDGTAQFIRAFLESGEDLEKYIISGISGTEPLLSPAQKGAAADSNTFVGIGYGDFKRIREEMLHTDKETLLALCPLFESMASGSGACIVGGESALQALGEEWTQYAL